MKQRPDPATLSRIRSEMAKARHAAKKMLTPSARPELVLTANQLKMKAALQRPEVRQRIAEGLRNARQQGV